MVIHCFKHLEACTDSIPPVMTAWTGFQMMLTDTAVGPITRNRLADAYTNAPASASENLLCQSMKMRKAGGFAYVLCPRHTFGVNSK